MTRHAPAPLPDDPLDPSDNQPEDTVRLPALPVADTVVLHHLADHWPSTDPDAEVARARRALRQRDPPTEALLRRILHGLRSL
ncbi:hypothetical protein [Saccharomonospora halophila]|uniref:hypothetical protein n=1 Tax=Saccharomonospora halophila TaxID=129922 RepID=UPI000366A117|nr:hypothetical protein [Saccharomonospora halophila]